MSRAALAATVIVIAATAVGALADEPPPPLRCLERYYGVRAEEHDGAWSIALTDGQRIPWDDRRPKSFEEKLAAPDVEDAFSLRYRPGPIRPVATVDEDPGRIRLDALFASTYGASERKVDVVKIKFQDQILRVHRKVAPAFARVDARLTRAALADRSLAPFLQQLGGTFVWRNIAGTDRTSAHSYGVSIDLNVKLSHYWRWQRPAAPLAWQNRVPQAIVDAFEAEGFVWGGRWYHYDTMHFEYRPELLDGRCYP